MSKIFLFIPEQSLLNLAKKACRDLDIPDFSEFLNIKSLADAMEKDRNAALILSWHEKQTTKILADSKGASVIDPRPTVLIAEKPVPGFMEVISDYHINRIFIGEIDSGELKDGIEALFDQNSPINIMKNAYKPYLDALNREDFEKAKSILFQLAQEYQGNLAIPQELANLMITMGEWDEAEETIDEVLEQTLSLPKAVHIKARCLLKRKEKKEAIKYLETATQLNPYSTERLISLGNLLIDDQQFESAKTSFKNALNLDPDNTDAIKGESMANLMLKEYEQAIEAMKNFTTDRERAAIFNNAAVMEAQAGAFDNAYKLYEYCLKIVRKPKIKAIIHYNLGLGYFRNDAVPEAVKEINKAASLNPENEKYKALLVKLEKIKEGGLPPKQSQVENMSSFADDWKEIEDIEDFDNLDVDALDETF